MPHISNVTQRGVVIRTRRGARCPLLKPRGGCPLPTSTAGLWAAAPTAGLHLAPSDTPSLLIPGVPDPASLAKWFFHQGPSCHGRHCHAELSTRRPGVSLVHKVTAGGEEACGRERRSRPGRAGGSSSPFIQS